MTTETHAESHAGHDASHEHPKWLAHHFDTPKQQFESAKLGMWLFLAQEILFFSGLFVAYFIFRTKYPDAFWAGSHQLDKIMGGANTIVLLFSSLTAALAVRSAQLGERSQTSRYLVITIACAFIFLIVKYFEYSAKFEHGLVPNFKSLPGTIPSDPGALWHPHHLLPANTHLFFGVYFMLTGLHGIHVLIGIGVMIWILIRNNRGDFNKDYWTPVDLVALYWHLVDLIWIYLFPLLYLI